MAKSQIDLRVSPDRQRYAHLEIQGGNAASGEFLRVRFGDGVSDEEKATVRERLEEYCGLDTLGMVKLVEELRRISL